MSEPIAKLSPGFRRVDFADPELDQRIMRADQMLACCQICPRRCGAFRLDGEAGDCQTDDRLLVSSWNLHHGEEPPLSGSRGSGTIFFTGCSLRCVYCQNYTISQQVDGKPVKSADLVRTMLTLQEAGAHNINFVTPTHYTAQILRACVQARRQGLTIPYVYNTSGYDLVEPLRSFDGIIDIYLADMRYGDNAAAVRYSSASDYVEVNRKAIAEMYRQVGNLCCDDEGIAVSGLIVRHLVLPEGESSSAKIFDFLSRNISPEVYISLMSQYYPTHRAKEFAKITRRITEEEYEEARRAMAAAGLVNGWVQGI